MDRQLTIAALAKTIHQGHNHVYRVLKNQAKHKHVLTLVKLARAFALVNADGLTDIDAIAHQALDFNNAHFQKWTRDQMIKNQIPSTRQLAIRAGLELRQAQEFLADEFQYIQVRIYRNIARGLGVTLCNLINALVEGSSDQELLTPLLPPGNVSDVNLKTQENG
ncbi:MAG TPA: hypothetical protein V6D22_16815 [Candidatus Obscuribacterales bacterium]